MYVQTYLTHLHLHSGVHCQAAFTHLHVRQLCTQEHLMSALHAPATWSIVIQTGVHFILVVMWRYCCATH